MLKRVILMIVAAATIFASQANTTGVGSVEITRGEAIVQDTVKHMAEISHEDGRYSISIGGNINMRASYDFAGAIDHPDFITSLISTSGDYSSRRFYMDATTSRIELKGLARDTELGDVELCLNADMRGGSAGSYTPRVRLAYVSFSGWLIGRSFTAFCDVEAAAPNIDFQGPSVSPYIYTTQVRYLQPLFDNRLSLGAAVEYHGYNSATLGSSYGSGEAYMPNFVAYLQRSWSSSHIRLTALYKSIPLYDHASSSDVNLNGWGSQLSGSIGLGRFVKIYYSATCGEGITDYIQDTYGSGLDVVVGASGELVTPLLYGYQAAGLVQLTDQLMFSAGYSMVEVTGDSSLFAASDYSRCDYLFGNIFYSLTSRIQLATEYLWGSRRDADGSRRDANRINTMIQYHF